MDVTDKLCHSWKKEKEMLAKMEKKQQHQTSACCEV